jgi:SAM-dependent methyltransferase
MTVTGAPGEPSSWLVENADLLPRPVRGAGVLRALDVACGAGRHAVWLAQAGFDVTAVDRNPGTIAQLRRLAADLELPIDARVLDLERDTVWLGEALYDVVAVFRYLHRPLFGPLQDALRPGGVLVYETFTVHQAARGRPANPDFLLEPGELPRLMAPLEIIRVREGGFEGNAVASVVARKPQPFHEWALGPPARPDAPNI